MADRKDLTTTGQTLFDELSRLIEQSKQQVVRHANSTLTILFWRIGSRINREILKNKRGEYAKQIVSTVSTQLKDQHGKNFELRNLRRMMQFAEQFSDEEIVVTLSRQLSWSHILVLLPLKNPEAKHFYANFVSKALLGSNLMKVVIDTNIAVA